MDGWMDVWIDEWFIRWVTYTEPSRSGGNTRTQQEPDTQSFFWIPYYFDEGDGACPPQVPHVTSPRIAFACYSLSRTLPYSRRMFSIACHSFYRIQIPIHRPQEPFLVHATVSPYSFHFFNAFRECERAFIFSFFGPTNRKFLLREETKDSFQTFSSYETEIF